MHKPSYYTVNAITLYRLLSAPLLLVLLVYGHLYIFKWLLTLSFLTDAIDGYLARKFKVTSALGSILDSVSDDMTIAVAIIGIVIINPEFLRQHSWLIGLQLVLFIIQVGYALIRYGKITSFHTYLAKFVTVFQGIFLALFYFFPEPVYLLFYFTCALTIADLTEEIILVALLPIWKTDVKGLYWVLKSRTSIG